MCIVSVREQFGAAVSKAKGKSFLWLPPPLHLLQKLGGQNLKEWGSNQMLCGVELTEQRQKQLQQQICPDQGNPLRDS